MQFSSKSITADAAQVENYEKRHQVSRTLLTLMDDILTQQPQDVLCYIESWAQVQRGLSATPIASGSASAVASRTATPRARFGAGGYLDPMAHGSRGLTPPESGTSLHPPLRKEPSFIRRFFDRSEAAHHDDEYAVHTLASSDGKVRASRAGSITSTIDGLDNTGTYSSRRQSSVSPFEGEQAIPFLEKMQKLYLSPPSGQSGNKRDSQGAGGGLLSLTASPGNSDVADFMLDDVDASVISFDAGATWSLRRGSLLPPGDYVNPYTPVDDVSPLESPRDGGDVYVAGFSVISPMGSRRNSMSGTPVHLLETVGGKGMTSGGGGAGPLVSMLQPSAGVVAQCDAAMPLPLRMPQTATAPIIHLSQYYTDVHPESARDHTHLLATRVVDATHVKIFQFSINNVPHFVQDELLREVFAIINVSGRHPHFVTCLDAFIDASSSTMCIVEEDVVANVAAVKESLLSAYPRTALEGGGEKENEEVENLAIPTRACSLEEMMHARRQQVREGSTASIHLTEQEAIRVIAQLMDALNSAHFQGQPHRNITTGTIMVIPHDLFDKVGLKKKATGTGDSPAPDPVSRPVPSTTRTKNSVFDVKLGKFGILPQNGVGKNPHRRGSSPPILVDDMANFPFCLDRQSEGIFTADVAAAAQLIIDCMDPSINWKDSTSNGGGVDENGVSHGFKATILRMMDCTMSVSAPSAPMEPLLAPMDVLAALGGISTDRVMASTGVVVIRCDAYGIITGWNRAAEELFGYTEQELLAPLVQAEESLKALATIENTASMSQIDIQERRKKIKRKAGTNIGIIMGVTMAEQHAVWMKEYRQKKEKHQVGTSQIVQCRSKSGAEITVELRVDELAEPIPSLAGRTATFVAVIRDVSSIHNFEAIHRLNVFGSAIPHSLVGVAVVGISREGTITEFNRSAAEMFGYQPDNICGSNVNRLMPHDIAKHHDTFLASYWEKVRAHGGEQNLNVEQSIVNNTLRCVQCRASGGQAFTARMYVASARWGFAPPPTPKFVATPGVDGVPTVTLSGASFAMSNDSVTSQTTGQQQQQGDADRSTALWGYLTTEQSGGGPGQVTFLSQVCESICIPVVVISSVGSIRRVSRAAEEMFGWSEYELLGKNVRILIGDETIAKEHQGYIEGFKKYGVSSVIGIGTHRTVSCARKDGVVFDATLNVQIFHHNGVVNFMGFFSTNSFGQSSSNSVSAMGGHSTTVPDFQFPPGLCPGGSSSTTLERSSMQQHQRPSPSRSLEPANSSGSATTTNTAAAAAATGGSGSTLPPTGGPGRLSASLGNPFADIPCADSSDDLTPCIPQLRRGEPATPDSPPAPRIPTRRGSTLGHFAKRTTSTE